jgi:hypothetical protein
MRLKICLAALAASFVAATPAVAQQASAQAEARGVVLQSLTLSRISDLDFGTVAGDALLPGTVTVNPNTGIRSTGGAVVGLPGTVSRAQFDGYGSPNQQVLLTLNQPAGGVLVNGTNNIGAVLSLDSGGTTRTVGTTGVFTVYVGGTFSIAASQAAGLYSANFDLTADYQ